MKIVILGPSVTNFDTGGVAIFDEGLYSGFKELGDEVYLISINKSLNLPNISLCKKQSKSIKVLFKFSKIRKILKTIQPDLVISSLHYSLGIKKYKNSLKSTVFIDVLHGFSCKINGSFKSKVTNFLIKESAKYFDRVVSVSYLTHAINKKINCIESDFVIPNGCNVSLVKNEVVHNRKYDFIYVGRLYKDKEVMLILEAFKKLHQLDNNLKFAFAGYGELEYVFKNPDLASYNIEFLGKKEQEDIYNLFAKSKFLISLNALEPFGIVFLEALINGCNIVTQSTSGFSFFEAKNTYYHFADSTNLNDLVNRLADIKNNFTQISLAQKEELIEKYSYKKCASKYKDLLYK